MATSAEPATLHDAHASAITRRPASDAPSSDWADFHFANARMYRAVADYDRWHHHEALYWAGYEERQAARRSTPPEEDPSDQH
ncbi:AMED_5909 family protein [Amycolatopsis silviterrae]|uniref:AMED_5909 family protein n=1 Tax=Amycolatopsis silviterrae TaxID=1656914 RepID=A0ABW5HNG5_9PSEU